MPNTYTIPEPDSPQLTGVKVGPEAGAEQLGLSVSVLAPGSEAAFHDGARREELP